MLGALATIIALLAWVQSKELFSLELLDYTLMHPEKGSTLGLPNNVSAVALCLLPSTKSSQTAQVDVHIAYTTSSGLSVGWWLTRLLSLPCSPLPLIFSLLQSQP